MQDIEGHAKTTIFISNDPLCNDMAVLNPFEMKGLYGMLKSL